MHHLPSARLYVDVYSDRLVWATAREGVTVDRGECLTFDELAAVAKKSDAALVMIDDGFRTEEVRAAAKIHGWGCIGLMAKNYADRCAFYDLIRDAIEGTAA